MTTDMELVDMPSPSAKDDSSVLIELDSDNENCNPAKKRKLDENAAVKTPRTAKKQKEEDKERLKRKEEQQRKREEEKRKKEEEKKKKEEEKEEEKRKKEEEKRKKEEEKRIAAEEKRKEKEEKEAQLRKEKEEKEARRREEQEEKLRKKKEEEDRKDQKRREEEEMLKKKQRQSERFLKFFNKPKKEAPPTVSVEPHSKFKPFQIKGGMRLAPLHVRTALTDEEKANLLQIHLEKSDYISTAKLKKPYRKRKVAINNGKGKFKLFQFHDNYRPPYYGTFSKKRRTVSGRRPFKAEPTINYDYNSDEEWECDVAEGEECDSHDEEDNEKEEEVDEENDGFFVDHGYLSDGEGSNPEAANETKEERKRRRAQHATEWKEIQKSKSKRYTQRNLQPNMYGPTWIAPEEDLVPHHIFRHLLPGVLFKY